MNQAGKVVFGLFLCLVFCPAQVSADEFGYVYQAEVLPQGAAEFEQIITNRSGKKEGVYSAWDLREELEYGLAKQLSTAFYINTKSVYQSIHDPSAGLDISTETFSFEGVSSEWKYLMASPQEHWLGVLTYVELGYNGPEFEVEAKLVLEHHFSDAFIWAMNFMVENEYGYEASQQTLVGKAEFTSGLSYRIIPSFALGLEARNHREFSGVWSYQDHSAWFLGPCVNVEQGKWEATLTVLPQIAGQPETLQGDGRVLDAYEKLETRLIIETNF